MKRFTLLGIFFMLLYGCVKDYPLSNQRSILTSCKVDFLLFYDLFLPIDSYKFGEDRSTIPQFNYQIENEKVVKVIGGLLPETNSLNQTELTFTPLAYDSLVYGSNSVLVYPKYTRENQLIEKQKSPDIYYFDQNNRLLKYVYHGIYCPAGSEYLYEYKTGQILERNNRGEITRIFLFDQDNLAKVVIPFTNTLGEEVAREELILEEYDSHPNPFKGMFYLSGAFYRAFSTNNYTKQTFLYYNFLQADKEGLIASLSYSLPITYNTMGYPIFGTYQSF